MLAVACHFWWEINFLPTSVVTLCALTSFHHVCIDNHLLGNGRLINKYRKYQGIPYNIQPLGKDRKFNKYRN